MNRVCLLLALLCASPAWAQATKPAARTVELPPLRSLWNWRKPKLSEARFREVGAKARQAKLLAYAGEALTQEARAQGLQGKFDQARETLARALKLAQANTLPLVHMRIELELGRVCNSSGKKAPAVEHFKRAFALGQKLPPSTKAELLTLDAVHMLGIALPPKGQIEWARKGIALAKRARSKRAQGWQGPLYNNLGWTLHELKRYPEALKAFQGGLAYRLSVKQKGAPVRIARWTIARTLRSLKRHDEALKLLAALAKELRAAKAQDGFVNEEQGENLLALGKRAEALPRFKEAWLLLRKMRWIKAPRLKRLRALAVEAGWKPAKPPAPKKP